MTSQPFAFQLHHTDAHIGARRSTFHTPHGPVEMPAFMPVATQGTVKGLDAQQVRQTGAQMVLGNTYHLALRPGEEVVAGLGGLHKFMNWDGPILTDSGGFQVFSLAQTTKVTEEGARFRSHIDGSTMDLTPERAIEIQEKLGSDVAMVLDHVVALPNEESVVRDAMQRSLRWARRCQDAGTRPDQAQFGIVQGGLDTRMRIDSAEGLVDIGFPGYAIGGLSVGEPQHQMLSTLEATLPALPTDRPRYLMGVGRPEDLLEAIARGIDLFDCVMPTRNGRNSLAFTDEGPLRLRNEKFRNDPRPLDENCPSMASGYSRAYIRHLFSAREMLGPILLTAHNLSYYQQLLADARAAIEEDRFSDFLAKKHAGWAKNTSGSQP
jgi:queuine tRNA-ribosyltransferase